MIESIANLSMSMSAAEFSQAYSIAVLQTSMEGQTASAQTFIDQMIPPPVGEKGLIIDVLA